MFKYLNLQEYPHQSPPNKKATLIDFADRELWTDHNWSKIDPSDRFADLSSGVKLKINYSDPDLLLETAYNDLREFFKAGDISSKHGPFIIEFLQVDNLKKESFQLDVSKSLCRISASDIEGIRRGIYFIEDEMIRNGGPFLVLGKFERQPLLSHRISRCFYAPIKRPGNLPGLMLGDELLDENMYYQDNYLNRLSHEGVNGIWITLSSKMGDGSSVGFGDLVQNSITTIDDKDSKLRIEKLRRIVNKCLRYGIRIYLKTMEPHVPTSAIKDSVLRLHPDILGNNNKYLCASNKIGQQYLYESVYKIFKMVPKLGGIINISHGELYTTCLSALSAIGGGSISCGVCSKIPKWKILHNSLSAMQRGMRDASSEAELISWLYMPQPQTQSMPHHLAEWVYTIPANTPKGVILQFNFESGVKKTVFNKELVGGDYWIATPGPSDRFERIAEIAKLNNTKVSAKIQTGTDYSIATVPYIPVPSLIFEKFAAMREHGVSTTMLNWIVGSSPGLMNKAAGILTNEPFPINEHEFLEQLASIYWKPKDVPKVIEAWKFFKMGFQNYPLDNKFQYFGPMNDGPVWPLILRPLDLPLSPSYQLGDRNIGKPWLPSGDRVAESFPENLTFEEVLELCNRLSSFWNLGVELMEELESDYADNHERLLDISLAKAIGVQFQSGYNILQFYYLRDKMFNLHDSSEQLLKLAELVKIIKEEIEIGYKLIDLCNVDPRLGYHADAEGYKYFPEKLKWRIEFLKKSLSHEIPTLKRKILNGELLYPFYTGKNLADDSAHFPNFSFPIHYNSIFTNIDQLHWEPLSTGVEGLYWTATVNKNYLYVIIQDSIQIPLSNESRQKIKNLTVKIQPKRLWPVKTFKFNFLPDDRDIDSKIKWNDSTKSWIIVSRIPLDQIFLREYDLHPLKFNLSVQTVDDISISWKRLVPYLGRLMLSSDNPNDLGWIVFK